MKFILNRVTLKESLLLILVLLAFNKFSIGQNLTGSTTVEPNSEHYYTYHNTTGSSLFYLWKVVGGVAVSVFQDGAPILYDTKVIWGAAGSGSVTFKSGFLITEVLQVTIASGLQAPTMPTITNYPGYTRLTRGTPPSGETWYWQSTSTGTSTSNSSSYIDRTSGTVYYLRSYKNSTSQWSTATTINYTVNPLSSPQMPSITNFPGYTRLTRGTPPSGVTWYWQDTSTGTSTSNSSTYVDRTSGTVYYIRAYASAVNLWSTATTINYTITPLSPSFSDENYIHTITPRIETTDVSLLLDQQKIESITYFDGLGRPMQNIGIRAGGTGQDIITHIEYDQYGRQAKDFLPYSASANIGLYRSDGLSATNTHYLQSKYSADINSGAPNPYSEKELEASPLNRVLKQGAPGYDWRLGGGHEIRFDYQTNTTDTANRVKYFSVGLTFANNTYTPTLQNPSPTYYNAGELYKTVTYDENYSSGLDHSTEEFKDKQGRVILKRTYNAGIKHDTYYVYDDYSNLTYVLPPKMDASTATLTTINSQMNDLGYQYKYDNRDRLVEKKIPGKDWEYIVYDNLDRPVLTQDRNLRDDNQWMFTKYDVFGRVAYTGIHTNVSQIGRVNMQNYFNSQNNISNEYYENRAGSTVDYDNTYYYNNNFPNSNIEIHTVNYYDNYTFDMATLSLPSSYEGQTIINYNNASNTQKLTKGLATGSKVRVLDTSNWITTVTGYDVKGRPIYITSNNTYLGAVDIVKNKLDFTGAIDKTETSHTKGSTNVITEDLFLYDHVGRLKQQTQELNNTNVLELIADNSYDDLGQLITKGVGGKTTQSRLQTVNYNYNVRGWLKGINNENGSNSAIALGVGDLFGLQINYNNPIGGAQLFNGNISQILWKTTSVNPSPYNPVSNKYTYAYDAMNRILSAMDNTGKYDVSGITYDKNGNIKTLIRDGKTSATSNLFGVMDNLTYNYGNSDISNQLLSVNDSSGSTEGFKNGVTTSIEYTYDQNGNMLKDLNKGINSDIEYNYLNLPKKVTFSNGNISYIYDATGVKLQKKVVESGKSDAYTYYAGNYVYEGSSLKFFNHPEGYVDAVNGYKYVYQYKDHLGNIRLSYQDISTTSTPNLQIQEENNYYPFGGSHKGYNNVINGTHHPYGFAGKEEQDELGLQWMDFGARNYDKWLGRWMNIDPLAEKGYEYSPYNYAFNSPLMFVDPDGLYPILITTRSYAPFKSFGPFFARYHGDDRGHSSDLNASYRTSVGINYDTETHDRSFEKGNSLSYKIGSKPEDGTYSKTNVKDRSSENSLDVHSYGNNADQPGSWDIDQFTKLEVNIDGDIKSDHILNVAGTISGDDFPNQESLITDSAGNTLWLGNFATSGGKATGPTMDLARKNEGDVHINVNISINVNADGVFQSVIQGDKTISIQDWNKQFE